MRQLESSEPRDQERRTRPKHVSASHARARHLDNKTPAVAGARAQLHFGASAVLGRVREAIHDHLPPIV